MELPKSQTYIVPLELPEEIYRIAEMIHSTDEEMSILGCTLFAGLIKMWPEGTSSEYVTRARFKVFVRRVLRARNNRFLPRDNRIIELCNKYCI